MLKKYEIWNKEDDILTPSGKVYTAEQWKEKYPIAKLDHITIICAAGEINGALFDTLGSMIRRYEGQGVDFSACTTDQEKIDVIEAYEEAKEIERAEQEALAAEAQVNATMNEDLTASSLASIAASLEYQNMLTLEDVEV